MAALDRDTVIDDAVYVDIDANESESTYQSVYDEIANNRTAVYQEIVEQKQGHQRPAFGPEEDAYLRPLPGREIILPAVYVRCEGNEDGTSQSENKRKININLNSRYAKLFCGFAVLIVLVVVVLSFFAGLRIQHKPDNSPYWSTLDSMRVQAESTTTNSASTEASISILANHRRNFTVPQFSASSVSILSVSSDGQRLLAGYYNERQLHIHNITDTENNYVRTLQLPGDDLLADAIWAPYNDSIVCLTNNVNWPVCVMSVFGDVIAKSGNKTGEMTRFGRLSVSSNNTIYYTSASPVYQSLSLSYVYLSKNNGVTWTRVISFQKKFQTHTQAIKVSSNTSDSDDILVIGSIDPTHMQMRVYTTSNKRETRYTKYREIDLPPELHLSDAIVAFDGHKYIYVFDTFADLIHVWSVNGKYIGELRTTNRIQALTLDTQRRNVMYVGQDEGVVSVFSLQYS